ncbi:MAG: hypothetical protein ABR518_06665, partial [Actinomycetota bacterium]
MDVMSAALLGALVAVPGFGLVLALYPPGRVGPTTRLALTVALGYAACAFVADGLAVAGVLRAWTFLGVLSVVTVAAWSIGVRRGSARRHLRALRRQLRAEGMSLVLGVLVVAAIAAVSIRSVSALPLAPTSFRYWADAQELAAAGGVPALSLHYGALYPPATSKILLNAFNAGASFVVDDPLRAMTSLLWIGTIGVALSVWAVARELGLKLLGPLLVLLLVWNHVFLTTEITRDLDAYRAETVGRLVAFSAIAVGVRAVRKRRRADAAVAGVLLAAAAGTHLIPTIIAAAVLGWYAVAAVIRDRSAAPLRPLTVTAVLAVIVGGSALLLARGDIGFEGAGAPDRYAAAATIDQTLYLHVGRVAPPHEGTWYSAPGRIYSSFVRAATGASNRPGVLGVLRIALPVLALLVAAAMLWRAPRRIAPLGVVAAGVAATALAGAMLFSWRYDLYILGTFGTRRLFDYAPVMMVLGALGAVEAILLGLGRVRSWA